MANYVGCEYPQYPLGIWIVASKDPVEAERIIDPGDQQKTGRQIPKEVIYGEGYAIHRFSTASNSDPGRMRWILVSNRYFPVFSRGEYFPYIAISESDSACVVAVPDDLCIVHDALV